MFIFFNLLAVAVSGVCLTYFLYTYPFVIYTSLQSTSTYALPTPPQSTIATSPHESLRVSRRLSITSFELPRYTTALAYLASLVPRWRTIRKRTSLNLPVNSRSKRVTHCASSRVVQRPCTNSISIRQTCHSNNHYSVGMERRCSKNLDKILQIVLLEASLH